MSDSASLRYVLIAEGSSDVVLLRHLNWLLRRHTSRPLDPRWADFSQIATKTKTLEARIMWGFQQHAPSDLLFVHRDADREALAQRIREIEAAHTSALPAGIPPCVCVVPVRMTETWLLFDEQAIRNAVGNPRGTRSLSLPSVRSLESLPDPKETLSEALKQASELNKRRVARFRPSDAVRRVPDYIDDFSPLRILPAFQQLEADIVRVIAANGW